MTFFDRRHWSWKPQPDYTRLLRTLRREGDPAHVPFLELFADLEVIAALLDEPVITTEGQSGNRTIQKAAVDQKIRFWHQLGYDAFWLGADFELPELTRISTQDTAALPRQKRRWVDEKAGAICDWEDFDRYPWPRTEEADFFPLEYAARRLPEGIGIIAHISGVLEPVMWLMGYETFALMLYDDPGLVEAMFAKIKEIFVPLAASLVQMEGVIALWMGDDMGFKTGTMVAPQHLRSLVFPIQKQIATLAHRQGMPFLLHSCGNLEAVLDDLIDDVGIDARHSFEDVIEPVELFVSRYGERISVIGGVDVDLLSRGTEAQVRTRTREILERCSPSRGYVLGSGNSIANYVQPQNYLAMLDEGWRFNCGM